MTTAASIRKHKDHHDWVVIADGITDIFNTLAPSYFSYA